jgi:protein-tyrosine phosphatase
MRTYSFAPIAAREYPSVKILDHPYIWGGVSFCINVSEKPYSEELVEAMKERGIEWVHLPVSEELGEDWTMALEAALPKMYEAYKEGKKQVVHCDFGNNRSRSFVEAFYYLLMGEQFQDEYKGEVNHLVYNCKRGHIPQIDEIIGKFR